MILAKKIVSPKYKNVILNFNRTRMIINDRIEQFYKDTFDLSVKDIIALKKKHPRLDLMDIDHISDALNVLKSFNIDKMTAIKHPNVLIPRASSLKLHGRVLRECGFVEIKPHYLVIYYSLLKKCSIEQLKNMQLIPKTMDVYEHLCACFTEFPCNFYKSPPSQHSLYKHRMSVMQQYLEWKLDLNKTAFEKAWNRFFHFGHRPLQDVEKSLKIVKDEIQISRDKILKYPFIVCADPENTRKILDEVKEFNGIDALEVLRAYPGVLKANYKNIQEINCILKKNEISASAQQGAYLIYTLKPSTVEMRLKEMKSNQMYKSLSLNNRSLLLALYQKKVHKRMDKLVTSNKKCVRFNTLIQNNSRFESYLKKFGDKSNPDEIVNAIMKLLLPNCYQIHNAILIKNALSKHCFWNCVPIFKIIETIKMLSVDFSQADILNNCQIVLYPYQHIKKYLLLTLEHNTGTENESQASGVESSKDHLIANGINIQLLTKRQILALVLYFIEKEHYFSGDGIWESEYQGNKDVHRVDAISQ